MSPRASIRFVPDRTLPRQLRHDPEFQATLHRAAENVANAATNRGRMVAKRYRATVSTNPDGLPRVEGNAPAKPGNESFGGVGSFIEWGTRTLQASSPLRNAVVDAGLTLSDGGSES